MDIRFKTHQCKVLDAPKGKPIVAVVSTEDVDSDGDVIFQAPNQRGQGWLLDGFNKRGGRIYWMHDPWTPNLGKAAARVDGNRLLLDVEFDPNDPLAAKLDRKIRDGYLEEWSVGFVPKKSDPNDHGGLDIYEAELWEVSVVNQGAQPNTQTLQKSLSDASQVARFYEDRIRNIEAQLMRMEKRFTAQLENEQRAILATIDRIRSHV